MDLLTKEEFEAGFGSHTPMYTGQTKCVRYYMNFTRGLDLFRTVALKVLLCGRLLLFDVMLQTGKNISACCVCDYRRHPPAHT